MAAWLHVISGRSEYLSGLLPGPMPVSAGCFYVTLSEGEGARVSVCTCYSMLVCVTWLCCHFGQDSRKGDLHLKRPSWLSKGHIRKGSKIHQKLSILTLSGLWFKVKIKCRIWFKLELAYV